MRGLVSLRLQSSIRSSTTANPKIRIRTTPFVRGISSSSSSNTRIRHGLTISSTGIYGSIRPSINYQPRQTQIRSFSLLPSSLTPSLPEVIEETQVQTSSSQIPEIPSSPDIINPEAISHTVSTTDEALIPVSTIFDPIINPLSNFLISIPHPFGYGITIIVITLAVRTIFTLPVSLWQRKRIEKTKKLVEPELKIMNEYLAKSIARDFRKRGIGYNEYLLEVRKQVAKAQKTLHKKHSTHPLITTWSPLLLHIPIFVTLSLTIRRTLEVSGSPFFNESFLWLEKLGEIDPYNVLPLIGCLLSFGNAELVGRKKSQDKIKVDQVNQKSIIDQINKEDILPSQPAPVIKPKPTGPPPPPSGLFSTKSTSPTAPTKSSSQPRKLSTSSIALAEHRPPLTTPPKGINPLVDVQVSQNTGEVPFSPARQQEIRRDFMAGILRFSALGFGLIASQMPAGVTLYWVTSIGFSFVQNLVLSWWPQRKAEKERVRKLVEMERKRSIPKGSTIV